MSMNQKERMIKEKRTMEAVKKNYMGPAGKFGIIVKNLGSPIIRQNLNEFGFGYDTFAEVYGTEEDVQSETTLSGQEGPSWINEITDMSDDNVQFEGMTFSGLSRGMHLEINYFVNGHTLNVTYKGYEVYKESGGEIEGFAPFDDWEQLIERLHKSCKDKVKVNKKREGEEANEAFNRKKENFIHKLRMKWGI